MTSSDPKAVLSGSVVFGGWTPRPDALVRIELLDVTRVDAASTTIAAEEIRFGSGSSVPEDRSGSSVELSFTITAPPPDPHADYNVAATVTSAATGEIVARTIVACPVLTHGYPDRDIEVPVTRTTTVDD